MKTWYRESAENVLRDMGSSRSGLTQQQAEAVRKKAGENVLQEGTGKKAWQVFLEQFQDLLVIILIAAAGISMVSDNVESAVVIFAVILMNAVLGTVQHEKARKSLDSLKSLSSPSAKVIRNGQTLEIPSAQVVPGDLIALEAGDLAVADGRLLECHNLQVNESSLTGESLAVEKQAEAMETEGAVPLGDQFNMIFSGSLIIQGRAVMVATATGMHTEIGKIAALMNATGEKKTPLQISLDRFSGHLAAVIMGICALVFALSLYRKMPVLDSLMFAVALAVAAIPEALGSIVTIVQAMGTQRMARENAIIKDLKAVESLGCVSVICSDKTGTLTQNKMTVEEVFADGELMAPGQISMYQKAGRYLVYGFTLANDARLQGEEGIGDPTELALLEMAVRAGADSEELRREMPRLEELPFDSERKLMSTVHMCDGQRVLFTKGAMDVILDRTGELMTKNGAIPMTPAWRQRLQEQNRAWSEKGLRVLAVAYRPLEEMECCSLEAENGYVFLGMAAMMDPPRIESRPAVLSARRAGIHPVMITGDHKITAAAIAKRIGILTDISQAVEGSEIDGLSDEELKTYVEDKRVYARVSPEHKIRIVRAWQEKGNIVAMTGDGVNDAPALKQADIGVAMGITGSEVSKDAAAMVLTDDNFATIIKAVENGRNVYANIKDAIQFLLSGNFGGILAVLYASIMALPVPFAPVHLLFINLLTDSLPAIALGLEPHNAGVMKEKPRPMNESILTKPFLASVGIEGFVIAVMTMVGFMIGYQESALLASTMAFGTLCLSRLVHGYNCKSKSPVLFKKSFFNNKYLQGAFLVGFILITLVLTMPLLQSMFKVQTLNIEQLMIVYGLALANLPVIQFIKYLRNR